MSETTMRKSDRWIPWYFVAFFAVLFVFDGIFVYIATATHTGVVTDDAYNKGLAYNETVAAAEAQSALGWQGDIKYSTAGTLTFTLADKHGAPLEGAFVGAEAIRPTQEGLDFTLELSEIAPGIYETEAEFPLKGQWDVRLFVQWNQQQFQQSSRLHVK